MTCDLVTDPDIDLEIALLARTADTPKGRYHTQGHPTSIYGYASSHHKGVYFCPSVASSRSHHSSFLTEYADKVITTGRQGAVDVASLRRVQSQQQHLGGRPKI